MMYLQSVLSGEALVATWTGERFYGEMDPLVPLQIMITIKTLRTLIAFEWSILIVDDHSAAARTHYPWRSCITLTECGIRCHGRGSVSRPVSGRWSPDIGLAGGVGGWRLLILILMV